jgi:hypothetical protein
MHHEWHEEGGICLSNSDPISPVLANSVQDHFYNFRAHYDLVACFPEQIISITDRTSWPEKVFFF